MKMMSKAVLALLGSLGTVATAQAASPVHVIRLTMPDGSIQQIRYTGKLPPRIIIVPARPLPLATSGGAARDLERIMSEMERRTDRMLARVAAARQPAAAQRRGIASMPLPPGTTHYSFVSTSRGGKTCARSVRITAAGENRAKVVSQTFGDCVSAAAPATRAKPAERAPKTDQRKTV